MESEATFGLNQGEVQANTLPDPIQPLRWVIRYLWLVALFLLALAYSFPSYALVYLALELPLAGSYWYAASKVGREDRDYEELFRNRADFSLSEPPLHPEEAAAKAADERLPAAQRKHTWVRQVFPAAFPVAVAETIHRPDGTTKEQRYWRMTFASKQARAQALVMGAYVKASCPTVYKAVTAWWHATVADKISGQLWVGKRYQELAEDAKGVVRHRGEVELFAGLFIAMRPDTWGKRFDQRPYFRDFYALRMALAKSIPGTEIPTTALTNAAPWPLRFRRKYIYLGRGFSIDEEMGAKFYGQKFRRMYAARQWIESDDRGPAALQIPGLRKPLVDTWRVLKRTLSPRYRRHRALMQDALLDTGARWILGLGWRKMRPIFTHFDRDMAQHAIVGGASGYGKTVLAHCPLIAAIYNGSSVMYLDPKVDPSTASKILYHAGLAGRLDDIVIVSVSRSDNPYNSTFNPLSGFYDPSQIGNILAGLMPEDAGANQYFLDDARNIGRIVGTTVHWINQFLAILCDRNELGFHPPRLLLWLQYARSAGVDVSDEAVSVADKRKHVDTAYTAFTGIWQRLQAQDRSFIPASETERTLFTMWCQPEYTPRYWKLSFHHLLEFALNNRQRLLSWYMRIVYPYVCMTDERFADVLFPRSDTHEMVTGFNPRPRPLKEGEVPPPPLIELFEKSRAHLLSPGALNLADRTKTMWSYLYERDIDVDQVEAIQQVLVRSERSFSELLGQVKRDPEEYGQGVANLRPIVNEIVAGEKFDLLCVPEPQCTWPVIHQQKKIAIFMLGSMTDQKASDHVSRAIVQSLLAYAGYLQDRASPDMDLLFVGDEAFSWMNTTWASIVDKCRSTGIRTMALCQTLPGMRHAIKSADLFKHISGNVRNVFTCATNLKEDQDAMIEGVATFPVYRPQRNLSEQPAAAGEAAQVSIAGWGTSESWTFVPDIQPLMEPQHIGALPKGVFVQRVQKEFTVFQAPLLKEAPFTLHAFLGLDGNPSVLVEGVHYDVTDKSDRERMRTWATDERLAQALGRKDMMDPDDVVAIPSQAPFGFHHLKVDPRDLGIAVAPTAAPVTQADPPAKPKAAGRRIPLTDPVAGEDLFASASQALPVEDGNELEVDPEEDLERRAAEHAAMADAPPGLSLVEQEIDGLCARGAIDANGQRTGHWFLFTAGNVPAGDGFYDADIRVGMWEFRDASGAIARRATYAEGALVTEEMVQPPSPVPLTALPPGPLPKPIVVDEKDAEGLRYRGLMRENGLKVGTWEVFRADGTRSEVQHFHMVTGKPVGIWERYDEHGDLADTYSPA